MSDNQKISSSLLEDERIQKKLSERFRSHRYWTFQEGINFFLSKELQNSSFLLLEIISDDLFKCMKQDVEPEGDKKAQRLKTFNSVIDAEQIVTDINKAKWSVSKNERKLSFDQIQEEKRRYFCSKIKVKPEILICYIIDHIHLFSSEVEIPPILQDWLSTVKDLSVTVENIPESEPNSLQTKDSLEDRLNRLIIKVTPEIELLYEEIKAVAKEAERKALDLRYEDGKKAFQRKEAILKFIKLEHIEKDIFGSEKPYRDIKGRILKKITKDEIPELIKNKKGIKIDTQALQKRMNDLKKKTA